VADRGAEHAVADRGAEHAVADRRAAVGPSGREDDFHAVVLFVLERLERARSLVYLVEAGVRIAAIESTSTNWKPAVLLPGGGDGGVAAERGAHESGAWP
jgi:hypothetical protein